MAKILIADDERAICDAFSELLRHDGHTPLVAASGAAALEIIEAADPEAVFLDVRLPDMDGLRVLERIRERKPDLPVIVMTAYGTLDTAKRAMGLRAFDYLGKPVELARVRELLTRALHRPSKPSQRLRPMRKAADQGALIGSSAAMQEIFKQISLLGDNRLPVLLTGEPGVGKEIVARSIHASSQTAPFPWIAVSCAAISESLLESELFGREPDARTDARERRIGCLEAAGGGTLFLDDISELSLALQSKLLRVLQEKSFERLGGSEPILFDARLIAATDQDLEQLVREGRFLEDLYRRLDLVTLTVPPLRERREDIEALAGHFLRQAQRDIGKEIDAIEQDAVEALTHYDWPGNVGELEHCIKRAVLDARGSAISQHDLELGASAERAPDEMESGIRELSSAARPQITRLLDQPVTRPDGAGIYQTVVGAIERELVTAALAKTGGNQVAAARLLGISRTTLRSRMTDGEDH